MPFKFVKGRLQKDLATIRDLLNEERHEIVAMLTTYQHFLQGKATKVEMVKANEHFRELLKTTGLGVFALLPFSLITIPAVVLLGHRFGVDILPKRFSGKTKKKP